VCPVEAILVGDLDDPTSKVAQVVGREPVNVRRPEKDTKPKLFYKGAHQSTLDPLAAQRPTGDIFAWAQQARPEDGHRINSGSAPGSGRRRRPRSSPTTWATRCRGTGGWAVHLDQVDRRGRVRGARGAGAVRLLDADSGLWTLGAPVLAGVPRGHGAVLIWDLEHPERFHYILTRPQWRSWLVRAR
jgi:hypothetical protein